MVLLSCFTSTIYDENILFNFNLGLLANFIDKGTRYIVMKEDANREYDAFPKYIP